MNRKNKSTITIEIDTKNIDTVKQETKKYIRENLTIEFNFVFGQHIMILTGVINESRAEKIARKLVESKLIDDDFNIIQNKKNTI